MKRRLFLSSVAIPPASALARVFPRGAAPNLWAKQFAPAATSPTGVASDPSAIFDGLANIYRMVYTALNANTGQTVIVMVTSASPNGPWTPVSSTVLPGEPAGMILKGDPVGWDVAIEAAYLLQLGASANYFLYYSGYILGGTPVNHGHIGLAFGTDGVTFTKVGDLIQPTPNSYDSDACFSPAVIYDGAFKMIYTGHAYSGTDPAKLGVQIVGASSADGIAWTKESAAVCRGGSQAWTADGVAEAEIVFLSGIYYLFLTGIAGAARVIGIATSGSFFGPYDATVGANPVVIPGGTSYDVGGLDLAPSILVVGSTAYCWFLGYLSGTYSIGLATAHIPFPVTG